jgi:transposase InsO family protein
LAVAHALLTSWPLIFQERSLSLSDCADPPVHLRLRAIPDEAATRLALRAVLTAVHLLGLAAGTHLRQLRGTPEPLCDLHARLQQAELQARLAWEVVEILSSRLAKIPDRRRPHYSPAHRFRILEIKSLLGWSRELAARVFLVCANTVSNWERSADPGAQTVGVTVKPIPPVRRFADVARHIVQTMARLGFGGEDLIAATLARAGWKISARSVRRISKERPFAPTPAPPPARIGRPVVARFVHHVWMMDVTVVQSLFGIHPFHVAGVYDAFSRVPLALEIFAAPPKSGPMARLFRRAVRAFGRPKYLITDRGGEFLGRLFTKTVARAGSVHRFGSTSNLFATARLERFWRTLKEAARLRLQPPLVREDLESRLELSLTHYLLFRPHQGLRGATPAEAFLGLEPAALRAAAPPRARPRERSVEAPFTVCYLDPVNRRFPILDSAA